MEQQQIKPAPREFSWRRLKAIGRNSWLLLGNVLLLIGGDDSVEISLAGFSGQWPAHASMAMPASIVKDAEI